MSDESQCERPSELDDEAVDDIDGDGQGERLPLDGMIPLTDEEKQLRRRRRRPRPERPDALPT
jgi:hypothetical protein